MRQLAVTFPAISLAELDARLRALELRVAHLTELAEAALAASGGEDEPGAD